MENETTTQAIFASPLEAAFAALDQAKNNRGQALADPFERAKARALLKGYDARYRGKFESMQVMAVETEFKNRLLNPETGGQSQTFDAAGKIDGIVTDGGRMKIVEHKTASDSLDPASAYWDKLTMDSQISAYYLAAELGLGLKAESIIYDVIRKPGLEANDVPILEDGLKVVIDLATGQRALNKNGSPRQTAGEGFQMKKRPMEPEEYEAKLDADIAERPDFYYAQREVGRLDSDIMEYMADAWAQSQEILYRRRLNVWPRNPSACTMMGTCPYFDLCAGHASVDGLRYARGAQIHRELDFVKEDGRQLLTNSRLMDLRSCARKHMLRYEERVERIGEEDPALRFGTLIHAGLAGWLLWIKDAQTKRELGI